MTNSKTAFFSKTAITWSAHDSARGPWSADACHAVSTNLYACGLWQRDIAQPRVDGSFLRQPGYHYRSASPAGIGLARVKSDFTLAEFRRW